jgi:hypothetical protein
VYYRRQLNFIFFKVHVLSDESSIFYTYDETVERKGADDVFQCLNIIFSKFWIRKLDNKLFFAIRVQVRTKTIRQ